MIREGYQQTVIGLIPSDWEVIAFFIMVRYVFEDEKRGKKGHHNSSNE